MECSFYSSNYCKNLNFLNSCYPKMAVNDEIGAGFVGAFEDDKIAQILNFQNT
jgi:hypothetical protein